MLRMERTARSCRVAGLVAADDEVARLVDQHRDDDDRADHDELPEGFDVQHNQPVVRTAMISAPMTVPMTLPRRRIGSRRR